MSHHLGSTLYPIAHITLLTCLNKIDLYINTLVLHTIHDAGFAMAGLRDRL